MARSVRNSKIDTRSARARLTARRNPYWSSISPGFAVGYRKGAKWGVWAAKYVRSDFRRETTIGPADDAVDADGETVFDYRQAQDRARAWRETVILEADGVEVGIEGYTVNQALDAYVIDYKARGGRDVKNIESRADLHIRPALGKVEAAKLTAARIRDWHRTLASSPARIRAKRGSEAAYRAPAGDDEAKRRRQVTANRTLSVLKAALNHAFQDGKVRTDAAWRRVRSFKAAEQARVRYLTVAECKRLINACPAGFRELVQGALLTGCRYGELCALNVGDFDPDAGTVHIRQSKTDRARHIPLSEQGAEFFAAHTAGRKATEPMFPFKDAQRWSHGMQVPRLNVACGTAKIEPPASFHVLRHSYASLYLMGGAPLAVVAEALGHTSTRMVERHYGHLSRAYVTKSLNDAAPDFGIKPANVVRLDERQGERAAS